MLLLSTIIIITIPCADTDTVRGRRGDLGEGVREAGQDGAFGPGRGAFEGAVEVEVRAALAPHRAFWGRYARVASCLLLAAFPVQVRVPTDRGGHRGRP